MVSIVANVAHETPGANLFGVGDIRLNVAQQVAEVHGINRVDRNHHELLEDPSIEAVMVGPVNTIGRLVRGACRPRQKRASLSDLL